MAATNIQGLDIIFEVIDPEDSLGPRLRLVCEIDDQAELDNEVTETDTKCGTFSGIKEMKGTYSGNAVSNATPTSSEVSYKQVSQWQKDRTLLNFWYYNAAFGSVGEGDAVYHRGQGNFTNTVHTGTAGEVVQFSWTFSPQGEIFLEPES